MADPASRPALVIGVLASCGLAVSLVQTLVVPLLPQFPRLLDASPATVAWLVTATLVAGAVCAPVLGRLGDRYGKRRMLLVALALVTAGSVLSAGTPTTAEVAGGVRSAQALWRRHWCPVTSAVDTTLVPPVGMSTSPGRPAESS